MNFRITRNAFHPYLFDLTTDNISQLVGVTFEEIQKRLGIESENYSRIDDGRYLMIF